MKATVCFDAVGGEMTGRMVKCMPKNSFVYVYGALDGAQVKSIDVISLIHMNATITGFYLPNWLENRGMVKMLSTVYKLGGLLKNELKSEIAMQCSLEEFEESVKIYASNMTKGKLILRPHAENEENEENEVEK